MDASENLNDSLGEASNASWVQEMQSKPLPCNLCYCGTSMISGVDGAGTDSVSELESLDPQKRELLEARFLGKVCVWQVCIPLWKRTGLS